MDSLTQIVLGAAVGELVLGKKAGNKAQLFGAIAGTLPDLDILATIWYPDDISEIALHRGYSHALFVHFLIAFPLAWITFRSFKRKFGYKDWYWLWFLGLSTHAILDSFTTYGTRLFLPFSHYPVGFNNISVIDPAYTLPFMVLLMVCLFLKRQDPRRRIWAWRAMLISSVYMLMTFGVKAYVHYTFSNALKQQAYACDELKTSPTFFNNALWAGMAISDSFIHMGEYSLLESQPESKHNIGFIRYPRQLQLEQGFESEALSTLKWFSQGAYLLEKPDSSTLNVYVVKWGRANYAEIEPSKAFVFYYELKRSGGEVRMKTIRPEMDGKMFKAALSQLWNRIWARP